MSIQVTLDLSDELYQQAEHLADLRQQDVAQVLTEMLADALPATVQESVKSSESEPAGVVEISQ